MAPQTATYVPPLCAVLRSGILTTTGRRAREVESIPDRRRLHFQCWQIQDHRVDSARSVLKTRIVAQLLTQSIQRESNSPTPTSPPILRSRCTCRNGYSIHNLYFLDPANSILVPKVWSIPAIIRYNYPSPLTSFLCAALDAFGVDYIELTSPAASEQSRLDCEAICKLGLKVCFSDSSVTLCCANSSLGQNPDP